MSGWAPSHWCRPLVQRGARGERGTSAAVGVSVGDRVRVAGVLHTVIAVSGTTVRLADTDGVVTDIGLIELSAAEDFEVVRASSRTPVPPATPLEGLPEAVAVEALW